MSIALYQIYLVRTITLTAYPFRISFLWTFSFSSIIFNISSPAYTTKPLIDTCMAVGRRENTLPNMEIDPSIDRDLLNIAFESYKNTHGANINLTASPPPSTRWDPQTSTCSNALKRLTYQIMHNTSEITNMYANVEVMNITNSTKMVKQQYEVIFTAEYDQRIERNGQRNNLVARKRSGNPGYLFGAPTVGGKSPSQNGTDAAYVEAQVKGFTVMDTGVGGQCDSVSTTGTVVGFGHDMYVSCMKELTRAELKELCISTINSDLSAKSIGSDTMYVPRWLMTDQDLIGIFGNADPLDRSQWIRIHSLLDDDPANAAVRSRVWLPSEGRCDGLLTKLQFHVLWTYVGSVDNPQAKIISAQKNYDESTSLKHVLWPTQSQKFEFVTTVTWTFARPDDAFVKPPPPTLLFSVPHDVFYPFQMDQSDALRNFEPKFYLLNTILGFVVTLAVFV
mmetsp:Transcript_27905/g.41133  ORF Transcript_27905/g.41133 Transcript_27905/m.41133 type:complete len:450 (+) Transcript_27905:567-1916(+)